MEYNNKRYYILIEHAFIGGSDIEALKKAEELVKMFANARLASIEKQENPGSMLTKNININELRKENEIQNRL